MIGEGRCLHLQRLIRYDAVEFVLCFLRGHLWLQNKICEVCSVLCMSGYYCVMACDRCYMKVGRFLLMHGVPDMLLKLV